MQGRAGGGDENAMLKNPFDKEDDGDVVDTKRRSPRPRDAATIILLRTDTSEPTVLMGKRSGRHDFMPDKYVFPGGRVDPQDGRVPSLSELHPRSEEKLAVGARRRPRAFALTAVRELFEETGLIAGKPAEMPAKAPPGWQRFYDMDVAPCLHGLRFIGRAITPPYRPKRFDARFFVALADEALIDDRPPLDGAELHDLQWVTLSDAQALDLPSVTRFMLGEIDERLKRPSDQPDPPFLRWTRSGHSMDRL